LVTKRQSGEFAKRITTKKRIARRRKTARPSTSGAVSRHADQELINRALDRLPVEFREVMVLRELEDSSYKEIAAIGDIPKGTVMSRLVRARKLLLGPLESKPIPAVPYPQHRTDVAEQKLALLIRDVLRVVVMTPTYST